MSLSKDNPNLTNHLNCCHGNGVVSLDQEPAPCPVQVQFRLLQRVLNDLGLPPTAHSPLLPGDRYDVTVVLLSQVDNVLNIFMEGNRLYPGGFLVALTTGWLSRQTCLDGGDALYVQQAISGDRGGQTYLHTFSPPRRVTYLVNHLLGPTTGRRRTEGEELAGLTGLDTPTSSSVPLNHRTDNKLLVATMCAEVGVPHPLTLGFWLPGQHSPDYPIHHPTVTAVQLPAQGLNASNVLPPLREFLESPAMATFHRVVVKPYGPKWFSCKGVTFHDRHDVTGIVQAILDLHGQHEPSTGLVVQAFHPTLDPVAVPGMGRHSVNTGPKLAFRVRAIVVRTPQDTARMTQTVCAINDADRPIGGETSLSTTLALTLRQWGVTGARDRRHIRRKLRDSAERLMGELMRQEGLLTEEQRGGRGCQTDLLGIDFLLTRDGEGGMVPVVVDVNSDDCLYHVTVLETMQPQLRGRAVGALVRTMVFRSQRHVMRGKRVVVVGAGSLSKRHLYTEAQHFGVKIVLVDSDASHPARDDVDTFLQADTSDHTRDPQLAAHIAATLPAVLHGRPLHGCLTFWEDCVPLAAMVARDLNLTLDSAHFQDSNILCNAASVQGLNLQPHGSGAVAGAVNAKSKALTQSVLIGQTYSVQDPPACLYASPTARIYCVDDVGMALAKIPLPVVLKPEFGSAAAGARLVHSVPEAVSHVTRVQRKMSAEAGVPWVGVRHGRTLVASGYLDGTEHDVDVVMFRGRLEGAFVSDNGPTRLPLCAEMARLMPSCLVKEQQRQLITAAVTCCRGLGLRTGVFNVELKLTCRGPRLLEVNGRMAGSYFRHWVRALHGVDLLHMALLCACGVRPCCPGDERDDDGDSDDDNDEDEDRVDDDAGEWKRPETDRKRRLMGITLYPSRHQQALRTTATPRRLQQLHDSGEVVFTQLTTGFHPAADSELLDVPFASLAVMAPGVDAAKAKLTRVCVSLGLETEQSLAEVLQHFVASG